MLKFLKGYRTVILNAVSAFVAFGVGFDWVSLGLDLATAGKIVLGLNVANILLRLDTNTAIGQKE